MGTRGDLLISAACSTGKIVEAPKKGYLYIDLEKAREYYLKGGVHKEIALQTGYTESDLNPIRNEWEDRITAYGTRFVSGWYLGSDSVFKETNEENTDRSTFKTEKQAKSALAYAQLTQLMALPEYNGDWVADWGNKCESKYCIIPVNKEIKIDLFYEYAQKICFKSYALASLFFKNNIDLLEQYFELD